MSELVERVARAMSERRASRLYRIPDALDDARVAIAAMREPTEAMQVAGATEDVCVAHTAEHRGRCLTPTHVWRAMIDAALKE
jgi:hypothetical protein